MSPLENRLEIRRVTANDREAVVDLVSRTLSEFALSFGQGSTTDEALTELPASYEASGGMFWVASGSAGLLGTCGVFPVRPGVYELRKMYLAPGARGTGLGKRLLDTAVEWIRARGGRKVVLDTTEKMTRAISFYEKHGFLRDDTEIRGCRCSRGYARELA